MGWVGDDDLAAQALEGPRVEGVDLANVRTDTGPTGLSVILVPTNGDKRIILARNANASWSDGAEAVARQITAAPPNSILVVDCEIPTDVVHAAVAAAKRAEMPVMLDPSPPEHVSVDLRHMVDYLTPNASEATHLTGIDATTIDGAMAAAAALAAGRPTVAAVKLPSGGCAVAGNGIRQLVAAPPDVPVVDKTGAGDAFAGALAWALLTGSTPLEAATMATAAAAYAAMTYGSQPAYPTIDDLDAISARIQ